MIYFAILKQHKNIQTEEFLSNENGRTNIRQSIMYNQKIKLAH